MTTVTLADAQARLPELVAAVERGEEVEIVQQDRAGVRLVRQQPKAKPQPQFGSAKGMILYMADDFDAPLEDFEEYM